MKQLQGFVRRAAALVLAAVLCLCAPAALAADDAAVSGGAVTMGGANTTLIPAEEENCLSWLFGSGDTITLPYLNIRGQGLKKNVTLNLVDCLMEEDACGKSCACPSRIVWMKIRDGLNEIVDGITLKDMIDEYQRLLAQGE